MKTQPAPAPTRPDSLPASVFVSDDTFIPNTQHLSALRDANGGELVALVYGPSFMARHERAAKLCRLIEHGTADGNAPSYSELAAKASASPSASLGYLLARMVSAVKPLRPALSTPADLSNAVARLESIAEESGAALAAFQAARNDAAPVGLIEAAREAVTALQWARKQLAESWDAEDSTPALASLGANADALAAALAAQPSPAPVSVPADLLAALTYARGRMATHLLILTASEQATPETAERTREGLRMASEALARYEAGTVAAPVSTLTPEQTHGPEAVAALRAIVTAANRETIVAGGPNGAKREEGTSLVRAARAVLAKVDAARTSPPEPFVATRAALTDALRNVKNSANDAARHD